MASGWDYPNSSITWPTDGTNLVAPLTEVNCTGSTDSGVLTTLKLFIKGVYNQTKSVGGTINSTTFSDINEPSSGNVTCEVTNSLGYSYNSTTNVYTRLIPNVEIISPTSGTTLNTSRANFTFNCSYTGAATELNASLWLNGTYNQTVLITKDIINNISVAMELGSYNYNIECCDGAACANSSSTPFFMGNNAPVISATDIVPDLNISHLTPYNITATVTDDDPASIVNITVLPINLDDASCHDYYYNGSCMEDDGDYFAMSSTSATAWLASDVLVDYFLNMIGYAEGSVYWYNAPKYTNLYKNNYYIFNLSNQFTINANTTVIFEFMVVNKSTTTQPVELYLVNNSAGITIFNSNWRTPLKSQIKAVCSIAPGTAYDHTHTANSSHYICPIRADSDGLISGLNISNNFMLALYSNSANTAGAWNFSYRNTDVCNASQWYIGNTAGYTTTEQTANCPEVHVHILRTDAEGTSDAVNITVMASDGRGGTDTDTSTFYWGTVPNFAPLANTFITPTVDEHISCPYSISWNPFVDPNGDTVNYTLYLLNTDLSVNDTLTNTLSTSYSWACANDSLNYSLKINASDGSLSVESVFPGNFYVNGLPNITLIAPTANFTTNGTNLNILFNASFEDPDSDSLNVSLFINTTRAATMTGLTSGGYFNTTYTFEKLKVYSFLWEVCDVVVCVNSTAYYVTYVGTNVTFDEEITLLTTPYDDVATVQLNVTDLDGATTTCYVNDTKISVDNVLDTCTLTTSTGSGDIGNYTVTVNVTDGSSWDSFAFIFRVTASTSQGGSCTMTGVAKQSTYILGDSQSIEFVLKDTNNTNLIGASCTMTLYDSSSVPVYTEPYDDYITSTYGGKVRFESEFDNPLLTAGGNYTATFNCVCRTGLPCYLETDGSDAGFESCYKNVEIVFSDDDHRGDYTNSFMIAAIVAIFLTGLVVFGIVRAQQQWLKVVLGITLNLMFVILLRLTAWFIEITNPEETAMIKLWNTFYSWSSIFFYFILAGGGLYVVYLVINMLYNTYSPRKKHEREWEGLMK